MTLEKHFVLPRSLFPEHANDPNNIMVVTQADHNEAHRLLNEALSGAGVSVSVEDCEEQLT